MEGIFMQRFTSRIAAAAIVVCAAAMLLAATGCGKKGPPVPPGAYLDTPAAPAAAVDRTAG